MAAFSSGKQGVGVYFVWPLSSAALAASLMNAGVSKSGSPAPNETTSTPAFFIALALALTARVIDSATSFMRSARGNIANPFIIRAGQIIGAPARYQEDAFIMPAGKICSVKRPAGLASL